MALTYSSNNTFFTFPGNASDGQIHFQMSISGTATPNGPFEIYVSAWYGDDDEVLHESTESGTGEMTLNIGQTGTYDIPIPQNDDGSYKAGTYRFRVITYDTDTAAVVDTKEGTVDYTPGQLPDSTDHDDLSFSAEYDCITGLITATDETVMTGWNDSVVGNWRTISVVPPPTAQTPNPTPLTDESDTLTIDPVTFSFDYTNALYQVALSISRVRDLVTTITTGTDIEFNQRELLGKTIALDIQCDTTLCDVAACVEDEFTTLETAACGGGGWGNLTARQKARLDYVIAMDTVRQLYAASGCQNVNKAAEYADKIKDFLNCGCGCDDTGQPTPYTAPGA